MYLLLSTGSGSDLTRRLAAAALLGLLLGTGVMFLAVGHRVEVLSLTQRDLLAQLDRYRNQVESLSSRPPGGAVVESVAIGWIGLRDADETRRLELEEALSPHLDDLVGQRLDDIDPLLVLHIIDGRSYTLGSTRYSLQTRAVLLSPEVEVIIAVETETVNPRDSD